MAHRLGFRRLSGLGKRRIGYWFRSAGSVEHRHRRISLFRSGRNLNLEILLHLELNGFEPKQSRSRRARPVAGLLEMPDSGIDVGELLKRGVPRRLGVDDDVRHGILLPRKFGLNIRSDVPSRDLSSLDFEDELISSARRSLLSASMAADEPSERRRLAGLAGHTGNAQAARDHLVDPDPPVRMAALRSLERLGDLTETQLETALADADHRVRIAGLEIAATRSAPPILHLLDDSRSSVAESAAWALGERLPWVPGTIERLSIMATNHDDPLARESAVAALGALGDDAGLPAILHATTDKPAVRRRAVISLSAFEGPEVDAAWQRARTDHDRQVREAAEELLGPE